MPITPFFNKTIISIIGIVLLCFAVHIVTRDYYVALHNEEMTSIKLEYQQAVSKAQAQHQAELTILNNKIKSVQEQLTTKTRELNHALKQKQDAAIAGVGNGSIRLRDKYSAACTATTPNDKSNPNASIGQSDNGSGQGRELSRQTAEALIRLATDAEQTNIALKACIQQYNNIKDQLHEQGRN